MNDEERIKALEEDVEHLSNLIVEDFYQTIQVLSSLVLFTERYYEGSHSRFVSEKSVEVGRKLGLNEAELFEIKIAGLLHDIGKIGFKEPLLAKISTDLKAYEFKQYSQHPELGKILLNKHRGFETIANIIYQHHERLDGSGFPNHLQGREILPGAIIIAVTDVFHNLFYKRQRDRTTTNNTAVQYANVGAYLESTNTRFGSAMNYIHQKKGVLFDRKTVEVFMDIIEQERKEMGHMTVLRMPVGKLEPGMIFGEDYFTSFGMLIAARGEVITDDIIKSLKRFYEADEIPSRILVMR